MVTPPVPLMAPEIASALADVFVEMVAPLLNEMGALIVCEPTRTLIAAGEVPLLNASVPLLP